MLALPPAPAPAPRRQLLVGTALACGAGTMVIGGMSALWLRFRKSAQGAGQEWIPKKLAIPVVPSNIMLLSFVAICIFAQWAVYSAKRDDKRHVGIALLLTGLLGLAVINAQASVYYQMELPIRSGNPYGVMFYAFTGTFVVFMIIGVVFSFVAAFRYLGGRTTDREILTAHAIYWYFAAAAFTMLWFVVYVTK
jgi:cytochrome c oxidase subunit 3